MTRVPGQDEEDALAEKIPIGGFDPERGVQPVGADASGIHHPAGAGLVCTPAEAVFQLEVPAPLPRVEPAARLGGSS